MACSCFWAAMVVVASRVFALNATWHLSPELWQVSRPPVGHLGLREGAQDELGWGITNGQHLSSILALNAWRLWATQDPKAQVIHQHSHR